jgi:hypothetical protein
MMLFSDWSILTNFDFDRSRPHLPTLRNESLANSVQEDSMLGPVDYTPQLEQIVQALNRPLVPTWLIAIMSALLGFFVSIFSQVFQHWYSEYRARRKMRMIVYSELGAMYSNLVHFYNLKTHPPEQEDIAWRKKQLNERFLKFEGEKYAEDHKDVFVQLKERSIIVQIYSAIREVFGPEEEYGFFINTGLAIEIIEDEVRLNYLPKRFVNRYMNDKDITAIAEANKRRLALGQAKA